MPIYDQSYAHWKGRLEGRIFRWLPIMLNGIRLPFRSKLFIALFVLGVIPFIVFAGFLTFYHLYGTNIPEMERSMNRGELFHKFLEWQRLGVIIMCLFVGTPLISRDLRAGALEVYFSKPLLLLDYLLGKFMVILFFLACMTLFPSLLLFVFDFLLSDKAGYFGEIAVYLPGLFLASLIIMLVCSSLVMASSSLARTARSAGIIWFAFHVGLLVASRISARVFNDEAFKLIDVASSLNCISHRILRETMPYENAHWTIPFIYLLFLVIGSLALLFKRVKGVEVVKS